MAQFRRSFAIIPAAGHSRRMARDKLLLPWRDSTIIESTLAAWRSSDVDEVIVVTRSDRQDVIGVCRQAGVSVVTPEAAPPEMKDSVRAGLHFVKATHAPTAHDAWLLAPADMPELNADVINDLLCEQQSHRLSILVPVQAGKRGHPVLFPWPVAEQVDTLTNDEGINVLLQRNPVCEIACDDLAIHLDLDTPEDYERLK